MDRLLGTTTALALSVALAGCGGSSKPSNEPAASGGTSIQIQDFGYHPSPLTVAPGATVTVTNLDGSDHTVTSDKAGAFSTDTVSKGKPVTFTAPSAPGTYTFVCTFHGSMHGTLVVKSG